MATLYNRLPFEVIFNQKGEQIVVDTFDSSEQAASEREDIKEILENVPLSVTFRAPAGSRFYMNGLDALPVQTIVEIDDLQGDVYLPPCEDFPILKKEYYPLVPSRTLIRVTVDGTDYYAFISIGPSQLTHQAYQTMIQELEDLVKGLSLNLIQKSLGLGDYTIKPIPPLRLYQFMVIRKHFRTVMASLSDLLSKINYRVKKEYSMEPADKARRPDHVTIRYKLTHPENTETLKIPNHVIDYDLPENRWVKHIVRRLIIYLGEFQIAVSDYVVGVEEYIAYKKRFAEWQESTRLELIQKERVLITLSEYRETASKIINGLGIIKEAPWYSSVSPLTQASMPHVLMYDPRYFALYRMYQELQQENFEVAVDPSYSYQYKRTDNLYEMWGFIKICELLQNAPLYFTPISGWIYDRNFDTATTLIPTLKSGTSIVFKRDDMQLRLSYDDLLPFKDQTDLEHPLYMESKHRLPDGRIDVFKDEIYIGSILFEMKYRSSRTINYEDSKNSIEASYIGRQIRGYATAGRSLYTYARKTKSFLENFNIVSEVMVFYPSGNEVVEFPETPKAKFLKLIPGTDTNYLSIHIENALNQMIEDYVDLRSVR